MRREYGQKSGRGLKTRFVVLTKLFCLFNSFAASDEILLGVDRSKRLMEAANIYPPNPIRLVWFSFLAQLAFSERFKNYLSVSFTFGIRATVFIFV